MSSGVSTTSSELLAFSYRHSDHQVSTLSPPHNRYALCERLNVSSSTIKIQTFASCLTAEIVKWAVVSNKACQLQLVYYMEDACLLYYDCMSIIWMHVLKCEYVLGEIEM